MIGCSVLWKASVFQLWLLEPAHNVLYICKFWFNCHSSCIVSVTQVPCKLIHLFLHMYAGTVNYEQNMDGLMGSQQTVVGTLTCKKAVVSDWF
jgi:hypothetical protein